MHATALPVINDKFKNSQTFRLNFNGDTLY